MPLQFNHMEYALAVFKLNVGIVFFIRPVQTHMVRVAMWVEADLLSGVFIRREKVTKLHAHRDIS